MDASNPRRGGGVALLTHNRDDASLVYALGKTPEGVTAYLEYPEEHYPLAAGQSRTLTETCLAFHPGDWRQALAAYDAWRQTWYQPVHAQDSSQYLDGNITYYCLDWHEYFGQWRDGDGRAPQQAPLPRDLYRYALPSVRQFVFFCGSEDWTSDLKFPFFHGQPLYDVSWFLYAGPHLRDMRRALRLQTLYADCFSSERPAPDVATEVGGVQANAFPGAGRTVWTLYNTNYHTVRGVVLAVPHRAGAVYRDLWHDRVLQPRIEAEKALFELTLHPQEVGCVVQE